MFRRLTSPRKPPPPQLAVITGAGGGIGNAIAVQLARAGSELALVDNSPALLARTAAACKRFGGRVSIWDLDVADQPRVRDVAARVTGQHGPPDALFNVAGLIHVGHLSDSDFSDIRRIVDIDLLGTIACCQAFLPALRTHSLARIVNTSSAFGLVGVAGYSAYNAAKFAVRGFTEALQQEVPTHVLVSCAYPGGVRTDVMRNGLFAETVDAEAIQRRFDSRVARTSAEEAAKAIVHGSARGQTRIVVGADARIADLSARLLGSGYQKLTPRLGLGRP